MISEQRRMGSHSGKHDRQIRVYDCASSSVFLKTKEKFGGLSNMAAGFPLVVNSVPVRTSVHGCQNEGQALPPCFPSGLGAG